MNKFDQIVNTIENIKTDLAQEVSNKGVATAPDASFEVIKQNIGSISGGGLTINAPIENKLTLSKVSAGDIVQIKNQVIDTQKFTNTSKTGLIIFDENKDKMFVLYSTIVNVFNKNKETGLYDYDRYYSVPSSIKTPSWSECVGYTDRGLYAGSLNNSSGNCISCMRITNSGITPYTMTTAFYYTTKDGLYKFSHDDRYLGVSKGKSENANGGEIVELDHENFTMTLLPTDTSNKPGAVNEYNHFGCWIGKTYKYCFIYKAELYFYEIIDGVKTKLSKYKPKTSINYDTCIRERNNTLVCHYSNKLIVIKIDDALNVVKDSFINLDSVGGNCIFLSDTKILVTSNLTTKPYVVTIDSDGNILSSEIVELPDSIITKGSDLHHIYEIENKLLISCANAVCSNNLHELIEGFAIDDKLQNNRDYANKMGIMSANASVGETKPIYII